MDPTVTKTLAEEVVLLMALYGIACVAGLVRTWSDRRYRSVWDIFAVGALSGFVGFSCVSALIWITGGSAGHEPGLLSVASSVGLLGKEATGLLLGLVQAVLKRFGLEIRLEHSGASREKHHEQ